MSFKASSLRKSRPVTGKAWNTTFLLVYLLELFDVGYLASHAQLVGQCSCLAY